MIAVVDYKMGNLLSVERGVRSALERVGRADERAILENAGGRDVRVHTTSDPDEIAQASVIVLPGVGAFADAEASMRKLGQKDVIAQRIRDGVPFLGICLGLHLLCDFGVEGVGGACDVESSDICADGEGACDEIGEPPESACEGKEAAARREAGTSQDKYAQLVSGMGFIPETVDRLPAHDSRGKFYKVPHVGWNTVAPSTKAGAELHEQSSASSPEQTFGCNGAQLGEQTIGCPPEQTFDNPLFEGINPSVFFYFTHSYFVPVCKQTIATTKHSVTFSSAVQIAPRAFGVQFHPEKSSDVGAKLLENFVRIALA